MARGTRKRSSRKSPRAMVAYNPTFLLYISNLCLAYSSSREPSESCRNVDPMQRDVIPRAPLFARASSEFPLTFLTYSSSWSQKVIVQLSKRITVTGKSISIRRSGHP